MRNSLESFCNSLDATNALETIKGLMSSVVDITNLIFFQRINAFLNEEIEEFGINLLGRTMAWVGSVALLLMTIWIMIQGFRIVTGQSRDSMAALVVNSLKATLIVGIATAWGAGGGTSLFNWMGDGLQKNITEVVTGNTDDAFTNIDRSLGYMQLAFTSIDTIQDGNDQLLGDAKTRAMWFTGIGTGGPAITAGVMLLLNKIALALFTGLGPIFILSLLFEQTKQLFGKWLFYGIGTMFSLAVLSVMVALALDIVTAVAASFWVGSFLGVNPEGVNSRAMQSGGLGVILTMLIISAPPMAANFFQGTMGTFYASSWFSGSQSAANTNPNPAQPYRGPDNTPAPQDAAQRGDELVRSTRGGYAGDNVIASDLRTPRTSDQAARGNANVNQQAVNNTIPQSANNRAQVASTTPQVTTTPEAVVSPQSQGAGGPPRGGTA
jgi:type IV secretion system protein VirB6